MKNNNENTNTNNNVTTNRPQQSTRNWLTMLGLLLAVFLGQAMTAKAAVYTVDTTADNAALTACTAAADDCSIGGAIANANASGEADTINFDSNIFGTAQTINLNDGFAILADGKLTINGSATGVTLSLANSNLAIRRAFGLFDANANLEISNLTLTGGNTFQGGGIFSVGTVTLTNTTISGNSASENGGGLTNRGGTLTLTDSTVSVNSSRLGGGIANFNAGIMMLINSTVSGNSSSLDGGGIANSSPVTVTNSTVSGNSASRDGGGIDNFNNGTVTVSNSTFSGNSAGRGGGIFSLSNASTLTLHNTIIANSLSGGDCFRLAGTINAQYSLIADGLGCVNGTNSNSLTGDPQLGLLQDNGGATFTHALSLGSIAIDAGSNALALDSSGNPLLTDQRGAGFLRIVGSSVDIGAFEKSFNFTGFFSPISNTGLNSQKAGSSILIRFSLSGFQGLDVLTSGSPVSRRVNCTNGNPLGGFEALDSPNDLQYIDVLGSRRDEYVYIWETRNAWQGTCRQLKLTLNDGSEHFANFRFK